MKVLRRQKGFTLIELLVAIAVVGILSTIGLYVYSGAQAKARDGIRKQDLHQIQTALQGYYADNGAYPNTNYYSDHVLISDPTSWPNFGTKLAPYIHQLPSDPQNGTGTPLPGCGSQWCSQYHAYAYISASAGQGYYLCTNLENDSDPQRKAPPSGSCDSTWVDYYIQFP